MKVCIVIESIDTRRGGAETSTRQFIHHLAERGPQVHVLTTTRLPDSPDMKVHTVRTPIGNRALRANAFLHRAAERLEGLNVDVVHSMLPLPGCHVYQPRGGTVAESVERNLALIRSPLARTVKRLLNGFNLKQQSQLRQEAHLFLRRPDVIVAALSRYVVDQLKRHYQISDSRIRLVFNGVDMPQLPAEQLDQAAETLRRELALPDNALILLLVAHNFKLKGVHRAIEALALLKRSTDRPYRLLVVGRDHAAPYHRHARALGVHDQVEFVAQSDRVQAYYRMADILVHPTYYDPCSRVVLEALAAGLPAVTTRHNGAVDVMEDGVHGHVIDSADAVQQLADAIARLSDPDHRDQCARNGLALGDRISMARHADEMLAVYEEILQRRDTG